METVEGLVALTVTGAAMIVAGALFVVIGTAPIWIVLAIVKAVF